VHRRDDQFAAGNLEYDDGQTPVRLCCSAFVFLIEGLPVAATPPKDA
jgi:hypothetical protein